MEKVVAERTTEEIRKHYNTLLSKPELSGLRLLFGINMFLLIVLFVMPQYFGIHIGYDITCSRFANIILVVYALIQYKIFNLFIQTFLRCSVTVPLMFYLFVTVYTMVFKININAFMLVFLELLTFYMLVFAIRYVIGINRAIKTIIGCAYFLSIYGFVEFAAGHSLYLQFLSTVPNIVGNSYRSGYYRIMGPCGHPIGYGLLLILLLGMACYDYEKEEIYLYKRPVLLFMLVANIFLTGSRSSQGIAFVEIFILFLLSKGANRKKAFFYSVLIFFAFAVFLVLSYKTRIGNYLLMQITILIDHILGTEMAVNFGADITTLNNSENYREYLLEIFKLDWLNPLLGRGGQVSFGVNVIGKNGELIFIQSVDNYYIVQYIKYAYPGLFTYLAYIITGIVTMVRNLIKTKSELTKIILIGFCCYYINLWWVDALQTLKFIYVYMAIFFAQLIWQKDKEKAEKGINTD